MSKYTREITDDDIAIALYLFEINSFKKHDNPKHQDTLSQRDVADLFKALKAEDVTKRGGNSHKGIVLTLILKQNGFVRCADQDVVATRKKGVSPK